MECRWTITSKWGNRNQLRGIGQSRKKGLDRGLTACGDYAGTSSLRGTMSRTCYAALPLALGLFAGAGCTLSPTAARDICLHSEGCGTGGGFGGGYEIRALSFNGFVTSAPTGETLAGVTVRIDAPARGWSETALTDSTGHYLTEGLPLPRAGDCAGLSVSFSREGYQPLRVTEFPLLTCGPGFPLLNVSLTPTP